MMENTITKESIKNTPKEVFTDKEHYLKFREIWKQAMNSEDKHKLTATHHLLYAMLRNKDWRKCFTPVTRQSKLDNGRTVNDTLYSTFISLSQYLHIAQMLADKKNTADYNKRIFATFLEPFKDTITLEMLAKLKTFIPTIDQFKKEGTIYFGDLYARY
jgi:hypothetical protein